jgi:Fur family transcriptional regulator, ferric uptake regulator
MTKQRQMILEQLCRLTSHPTADDIYHMLRRQMPKISLGTVYRNLEILSEEGVIQKLNVSGTQKRFDGNPRNHYHVRCQECGRVDDVDLALSREMEEEANRSSNYEITNHRLEFIGSCPQCLAKR